MNLKHLPACAILSEEVESAQGQRIGFIKDLMVDMETGRVAYAVLAIGGLFGIGTKLYAVPWTQLARRGHVFALTVDWRALPALDVDGLDTPSIPTAMPANSGEHPRTAAGAQSSGPP